MVAGFGGLLEVVMIVVRNFLAFLILIQKNLNGLKKKILVGPNLGPRG